MPVNVLEVMTVTAFNRHAWLAAGLIALGAATPATSFAQRRDVPGADTPRLLVGTFHTPGATDSKLGVDAAEAVRTRVQDEHNIRDLWVLPRKDINNYLTQSGYKADSALSIFDLRELAKLMRADEILDATATKTDAGVHIEPRLVLARDVSLVQPLPAVDARNPGDAAKQIEHELSDARKQLDDNKKCENSLREQKFGAAIAAANDAIKDYPNATLARLCLMTAYTMQKLPPDSILRVTDEILRIDPRSKLALGNAVEAYDAKGDTTKAIQTSILLYRADPSNQQLIESIVNKVASLGKPEIALPLIDDLLKDNPSDAQLLRTKWLLLLASHSWKQALTAGDAYAAADTAAATADFYTRQVAAAASDSQPQLAGEIAARGVARFPNDASLHMLYAVTLRKAGQLQQAVAEAQKAVGIDPKVENGWATVLVTYADMNQPDSALAWGKKALAAGADKDLVANALAGTVTPLVKAAQASKTRADWMAALKAAQGVDSIASSPNTKFFIGVSSFSVGLDALQNINKTKQCSEAQLADDMWATSQTAFAGGGGMVDKDAASNIMNAIQQYSSYVAQAKKALCKGK